MVGRMCLYYENVLESSWKAIYERQRIVAPLRQLLGRLDARLKESIHDSLLESGSMSEGVGMQKG